jgi:hypothetical protein
MTSVACDGVGAKHTCRGGGARVLRPYVHLSGPVDAIPGMNICN